MEDTRVYDLVIFGATGFTGQFVVDEVARVAGEESLRWAVAGRNMKKLQTVLEESSKRTGKNVEETPIIIADSSQYKSLVEMCKQAKVVLNCVGPYRFYGEQMVRAAIEGGSSHVDISGEPAYLEKMQLMYNAKAKEAGLYIVGACGFDSIPAEMGLIFTQKNFKGDLNSVEAFFNMEHGPEGFAGNVGTLESAAYGLANMDELISLRKTLFPKPLPYSPDRITKRPTIFFSEVTNKWCLPFPGSDKAVVQRTQRYNYDHHKRMPVQFVPYFCRPSRCAAYAMALFSVIFYFMSKYSLTRALLLKFPSFFTAGTFKRGGPSPAQIKGTSFTYTFAASGYSQKLGDSEAQHDETLGNTLVTKVTGPEPGYVTTPICMVQAGIVIFKEKTLLPKEGGVYTPGVAFANTSLIERLDKHRVTFQKM